MELAQRQERELLYASFSNPRSGASSPMIPDGNSNGNGNATLVPGRRKARPRSEMSKEEQMLHASSDVTESMRRTHDLMAAELSKSDFAHSALRESTAALSLLSESYSSLDAMLASSRALLGTLLKSQKTDTWYLQSAFYLLVFTLCWLVFRRLLWGPMWWLVWLPLKLIFRTTYTVSSAVVGRRGSQGVEPGSEGAAPMQSTVSQQLHMNNEGVPTAQVSYEPEKPQESSDYVMEEVSRIINNGSAEEPLETAAAEEDERPKTSNEEGKEKEELQDAGQREEEEEGETILRERKDDEPPNPKKRMMEEDPSIQQQQQQDDSSSDGHERPRDEL